MSFADPRDGDLEDDASSTSHHSIVGHATHMLLEISLPKLIIAAILLLVIPALLLGVAPKLAFWFVEQVWSRVSEFGRAVPMNVGGGPLLGRPRYRHRRAGAPEGCPHPPTNGSR